MDIPLQPLSHLFLLQSVLSGLPGWKVKVGEVWSSGPMDERRQKHQKEKGMGEGEDFPFQVAIHFLLNNLKSHTICEPED